MTGSSLRRLGGSELEVSAIALGSWRTFERMARADAERLLAHALERGVNLLDDARYDDETGRAPIPTGYSEVLFGELFRAVGADRNRVLVANKLWWEFWPREDALTELHGSLERMGFDRLDLLYSSTLPGDLPVAVAVEQIATVLRSGLVGAWGVVNWTAQALREATAHARALQIALPCAVQLPYSLARVDWVQSSEMQAGLTDAGASLIPSAVLAGGALTGKYAGGAIGRLSDQLTHPDRQRALRLGQAVAQRAQAMAVDPAALATAFTLLHPRTACALVGATSTDQLDAALSAVALAQRLGDDDRTFLRMLAESPA